MEEWGVLTREDSPLTALEVVRPQDLVGPATDGFRTGIGAE